MTEHVWPVSCRFLYIKTLVPSTERSVAQELGLLREFLWTHTARATWHEEDDTNIATKDIECNQSIFVFVRTLENREAVRSVYHRIRAVSETSRIISVKYEKGRLPPLDEFLSADPNCYELLRTELTQQQSLRNAIDALGVCLAGPSIVIDVDENDLQVKRFLLRVGKRNLALCVEKFFPDVRAIHVRPVVGGFSEASLCRVIEDDSGDGGEYFLKFYPNWERFRREYDSHKLGKEWLGRFGIEPLPTAQELSSGRFYRELFPAGADGLEVTYPLCFKSAARPGVWRKPLRALYRTESAAFLERSYGQVLDAIRPRSTTELVRDVPWVDAGAKNDQAAGGFYRAFERTDDLKIGLLNALRDLDVYMTALVKECFEKKARWSNWRHRIEGLIEGRLPDWLGESSRVRLGGTHSDLHSANILVNPDDANDLQIIDCGGFEPKGRLIKDLAFLECDLKFNLLGTDSLSRSLLDLDSESLMGWCRTEASLGTTWCTELERHNRTSVDPSTSTGYRIVARIRARAQELCGTEDPRGVHYFAALLHSTMRFMKFRGVHATKRLLAMVSVNSILRGFEDQNAE